MKVLSMVWMSMLLVFCLLCSPSRAQDMDDDGLPDSFEHDLIVRYTPWMLYDSSEDWWPTSITWFVGHSELLFNGDQSHPVYTIDQLNADPSLALRASLVQLPICFPPPCYYPSSDWSQSPEQSNFQVNLYNQFTHGEFAHGGSIDVGMYAHVVPLVRDLDYNGWDPLPITPGDLLIQYWQLFGYNDSQAPFGLGDHEGDWVWIDVVVDRTGQQIRYMIYHHHGDNNCPPRILPYEGMWEPDGIPRCYLEEGAHELWPEHSVIEIPDTDCGYINSHDGAGPGLRPSNVLNVGEQFAPMPSSEAEIFVGFNGTWGLQDGPPEAPVVQNIQSYNDDDPTNKSAFPASPRVVAYAQPGVVWSGRGLGSRSHPFPTVSAAAQLVSANVNMLHLAGKVRLMPGSYSGAVTIGRGLQGPITLEAISGPATIGR